jgi:hypothetical protein
VAAGSQQRSWPFFVPGNQQQPHAELRAKMAYGLLPKPSHKGQEY